MYPVDPTPGPPAAPTRPATPVPDVQPAEPEKVVEKEKLTAYSKEEYDANPDAYNGYAGEPQEKRKGRGKTKKLTAGGNAA